MSGYIGTKAVNLSTTTASVGGDSTVGGDLTVDTNTLYVDSTNNRVGVGTVSPLTEIGFPIGNDIKISQAAGTDHLAGNAGSIGLTIIDGGGHSGVFVNNSHDGTYSDQFITFKTAEGGVSAATERCRLTAAGDLLVGTATTGGGKCVLEATSANQLVLSNKDTGAAAQYAAYFLRNNSIVGSIQTTNTSTSFVTSSDHRLKENVTDVTDGITRVKQLEPKRFNFIADPDTTVDGFLAHQAQTVVPEAVTGTHNEVDDDGNAVMQGIDQSKLVPLLTAALKEAITKIETLETEMTSVKARLDALEGN
jgi:hypothetical protein